MKVFKSKVRSLKSKVGFASIVLWLCCTFNVKAQTLTNNYVITQSPRVSGITNDSLMAANRGTKTKVQIAIQYVDGLGRPIQTIQQQASPKGYDMIQPQVYDQYGREVTKYLPFSPETGTAGAFRTGATSADSAFYAAPPTGSGVTAITDPYAQTAFDNSPLSRPVEQGAPGIPWQLTGVSGGGHTVKMVYTVNNATAFSADSVNGRQVAMYYTVINSDNSQTLHANGYYPANTLTVTIRKDENWASGRAGTVEEYTDIDGHVVLKRVYNYVGTTLQQLSTYYVYDDLGRLAFVLPPATGADGAITFTTALLNNYCYRYQYDERGRQVQKRIPGKGWEFTVYNVMDQPVATQDSLEGIAKNWIFTKYDAQGRPVMDGIWNNGGTAISRASLQSTLTAITTNLYESTTTTGNAYTNVAWPTSNITSTLSLNYYDSYANAIGLPAAYSAPTGANLASRGQLIAAKIAVLNTSDMLWKASYFDNWGRSLTTYAQHYLANTLSNNNYDAISTTYDFTNAPTTLTRKHWNTTSTTNPLVTIYNRYTYDWLGRKLNNYEQITNGGGIADTLRLISNLIYNEIGQLYDKRLHSRDSVNYLQTITYSYNERGWLTYSGSPLFVISLIYNTGTNKQYNGNIAYQYWGVPGNLNNHYTYTYDKLNRLKSGITSLDNYQESGITYDLMGNITALNRYQAGTQIDQLTYSYGSTNQLQSVADANASNQGLVSGTTSYTYDGNGNMLSAANTVNTGQNKSFTYNLLNLPIVATVTTGTATYTYDAMGNKLRKTDVMGGVNTSTDYIGGIQYDGNGTTDTLSFIQTEEGKAVHHGTTYDYIYYLADNLGNTRVTFHTLTAAAKLLQQDDYYPFGMEISRSLIGAKNAYLYNKKELQAETSEYDYGARYYDPVIGRWTTIDPLAEVDRRWSPYNYVLNNPIRIIDPDGMLHNFKSTGQAEQTADEVNLESAREWGNSKALESAGIASGQKSGDDKDQPTVHKQTIVVLNAPHGANGQGHMAGLIQGKNGRFNLYSKNGTQESSHMSGPSDKGDQPGVGSFATPEEFMVSPFNPVIDSKTGEREYSEGYVMTVDKPNIDDELNAIYGELNKSYNVIGSNCATTIQAALRAAQKKDGSLTFFQQVMDASMLSSKGFEGIFSIPVQIQIDQKSPNKIYQRIKQQNKGRVITPVNLYAN